MAERSEVVAAWVTYLAALARRGPTVIVLDDVHRADPAFDALLTDCFTQLPDLPLLVLSTARPEHPTRAFQWVGTDNLTLTLRGLDASETDALLDHLLADDPVTEAQQCSFGRDPPATRCTRSSSRACCAKRVGAARSRTRRAR